MKRILYILVISVIVLVGCKRQDEAVFFQLSQIPEVAKNANDAICNIEFRIQYAKGGAAADSINKAILQCGLFPKECVKDGMEKDFVEAVKGIENYYKKEFEATDFERTVFPDGQVVVPEASEYYYTAVSDFSYGRDSIINYQLAYDSFMGGVRNNYQMVSLNFDPKTGRLIKIKDFIKTEAEAKIADLIVADVAKQFECASLQELQDEHMIFSEFDPYVPENFAIGRDYVEFIYQHEEIAPYAVGFVSAKIPYRDLEGCLKTH